VDPRSGSAPLQSHSVKDLNLLHPDSNSSGESHFLYLPSGKQPLCFPLDLYHLQFLQVRPELRRMDASTIISSGV